MGTESCNAHIHSPLPFERISGYNFISSKRALYAFTSLLSAKIITSCPYTYWSTFFSFPFFITLCSITVTDLILHIIIYIYYYKNYIRHCKVLVYLKLCQFLQQFIVKYNIIFTCKVTLHFNFLKDKCVIGYFL